MASIDQNIRTYLIAIEIEGKTPRTIHSYAESLEDFRKLGRRLGLPETLGKYDVAVGRQYSIRGSGGPPPARWAVACTLQRGLHRPPRSNQAQRGSG